MRLLILVLFIWSSSLAFAASIPAPRIGKYPGYSRIVVDLPPDASYRIELNTLALRVVFPGATLTPEIKKVKQSEFLGYTTEQHSDAGILTLVTPQGVTSRSGWRLQLLGAGEGKTGSRLVIDLSGAFSDISPLGEVEPFTFKPENTARSYSVVIDPGHGGTDPGARGVVTEAEVNLSVSSRVARTLSEAGVEVTMTRTDNTVFSDNKQLDLRARAELSTNKDLFVAIHANARPPSNALVNYGTEVYYFNAKRQEPVLVTPVNPPKLQGISVSAAQAENLNPPINPDGTAITAETPVSDSTLEPSQPEQNTLLPPTQVPANPDTLTPPATTPNVTETRPVATPLNLGSSPAVSASGVAQAQRTQESFHAASDVLSNILGATASLNRGVRTADYLVIKENKAPAILVEMGFVTHPVEGAQLKDANYLDRIAYGISRGVLQYLDNLPPDKR
jgi:N-acetylmuramoyl-L-alanine amidase